MKFRRLDLLSHPVLVAVQQRQFQILVAIVEELLYRYCRHSLTNIKRPSILVQY